jgi:Ca-activated chloride channel homolog
MKSLRLIGILLCCLTAVLNAQEKNSQVPVFRADVDTVYVNVTVMDPLNRYVTNLDRHCFKVYEDKILQAISHFNEESAPLSVGIIFDISGSMRYNGKLRISKSWFTRLMNKRNPEDEFFLITFNQNVTTVESFTEESNELQNDIALVKAGGFTAIYDAIYRGLDKVKEGKNGKKALIVFTDGEDNSSRYNRKEVFETFKESDVPVYCIAPRGSDGYGFGILKEIVKVTGGRFFGGIWEDSINLILTELRNQYLLGYVPANKSRNGKWRQVKIQLDTPVGYPKLKISAKGGYYGPK